MTNTMSKINGFINAYIACALWSSTDEDGEPLDSLYSKDDLSDKALPEISYDCVAFMVDNQDDLSGLDASQSGQDFWLTRNGHGAGFWDRGYGELCDRLTDSAKSWGSCDLYVGDDGFIHIG